jgi:hypothetical protein
MLRTRPRGVCSPAVLVSIVFLIRVSFHFLRRAVLIPQWVEASSETRSGFGRAKNSETAPRFDAPLVSPFTVSV